jgi:hypothetical protein
VLGYARAHGEPKQAGAVPAEGVHQCQAVVEHVVAVVGGVFRAGQQRLPRIAGGCCCGDVGGQAGVAVVEPRDLEAVVGEHRAQVFVEPDHLVVEAVQQQ